MDNGLLYTHHGNWTKVFQTFSFICSEKVIPTLMVDYTMGWFEDGTCFA
jgi:hypothetical protein